MSKVYQGLEGFLRHGHLFSRGFCQTAGHPQSTQWTDSSDQKFGIWNDVFLNFQDFHHIFSKPNLYGPILFCLDAIKTMDYLKGNGLGLSITQRQPHKWNDGENESSRWRTSIDGIFSHDANSEKKRYVSGWPDIVVSGIQNSLPLLLVSRVIIDSYPNTSTFASQMKVIAENCAKGHNVKIGIFERQFCKDSCECKDFSYLQKNNIVYKYDVGAWSKQYGKIA